MKRTWHMIIVSAVLLLTLAQPTLAQPTLTEGDNGSVKDQIISVLPRLIRWSGVVASVFIVVAAVVLLRITGRLVENVSKTFSEKRLLLKKAHTFFQFGVYLVTIVSAVLLSFRISDQILVVMGGTMAVAVGFAVKDLAASIIAGVMMLFDRPFQVGDRVTFGDSYGDVISMGLRSVKLRSLDDSVVTIPNNVFLVNVTSCGNYGVLDMQIVLDYHIGLDQDVDRAMRIVHEAAVISRYVYLPKPITVEVSQQFLQSYFALRIRLKAYVLDTEYEKSLGTDVTLRILEAFKEADIKPPAILHRFTGDPTAAGLAAADTPGG